MTVISDTQIVPRPPPSLPELRAADRGVADALEAVLADNTRRVYAAQRACFDLALVAFLSDGGLRRSEAAALTWGDVQRWDDGSGRITVVHSKTDVEAQGRRGGHHTCSYESPGRHSADGRDQRREGVRAFGIADRPTCEGNWPGRQPGRLGVLQRAGGHGPVHGPERRTYPRDRAPGSLEAGRRHGRPLHPRRIRRFGAAVFIAAVDAQWS